MTRFAIIIALLLIATPSVVYAVQPDEIMADAAQESRARNLSRELRCMVCQNQSIDDSDAPLARDLRLLVREQIAAGKTDAQVLDYLVSRYGEFVLLKPRVEKSTLLLWLIPPFVLVGGGLALWLGNRRRNRRSADGDIATFRLTPDEEARLERLISGENPPKRPV
ncbi:MAG: cytochrome c-type biogenesis protein CcmH [Afipia sp.]|jgi:cytochrome c-type biogenesis protein CcmH|nr:cytochrome c-type biogenesis protein CcmH [Afipia sp.]